MAITATPLTVRPHLEIAEFDSVMGRWWSAPMDNAQMRAEVEFQAKHGAALSDLVHADSCWCGGPEL